MNQDSKQELPQPVEPDVMPDTSLPGVGTTPPAGAPLSGEPVTREEPVPSAASPIEDTDDTVGTGTSIALGCIAGTLLLIVIGLIFVAIIAIF